MGMFDELLGNAGGLADIAARLGVSPEQMQGLMTEIGGRIAHGETDISALAATAAEYGVSADSLQELMGQFGGPEAIMSKIGGMFDRDGDGNPLGELGAIAKGLFG